MEWEKELKIYLYIIAALVVVMGAAGLFLTLVMVWPVHAVVPIFSGVVMFSWTWYFIWKDLKTMRKD